ncbi:hypothetical protein BAUCODRAFT_33894 [Baudoinia panamericana UAMH 10762]|uniref:Mediator of RNA polymerase II transcription subunit 6 n=1 Tax=Baudoinia panamericana (strain UAMH 10762) TaxID=717646 RepID=M2NBK8_BAUPA|nr:uncharacterized protein BAUCODRAFT_33894 [Baudoinia panamericana UAMH 10762]EMC96524.1 hypothetical protein BAUCODRAFT_33894 [Baudoinia panamericana UAMH 10762]
MAAAHAPLDEIVARRDEVIQWWMEADNNVPHPRYPMEERMIHRYFSTLQYFDHSSKNGLFFLQSEVNPDFYALVHDRKGFEDRLRERPGLEYVIAGVPQQAVGAPAGENSAVWVIRKQERLDERIEGIDPSTPYPKTETRGTYYIVNENAYQAPSVADVVGNRMLSAMSSLEKAFGKAKDLPSFTPATGYTYLPPTNKPVATTASSQASPTRSREGSVAPGVSIDNSSVRSGSAAPESHASGTAVINDPQGSRLLAQSLQMSVQFGEEFMDENPIIGEPGSFRFTSTLTAVKKRKADEEASIAATVNATESNHPLSVASAPSPAKAPTPPPVFSEAKTAANAKAEREKRKEEKRRKKSRANLTGSGTTPTTPGSSASALPINAG